MTGEKITSGRRLKTISAVLAAITLMGCDEDGNFAFPSSTASTSTGVASAMSTTLPKKTTQDMERPDIFEVTDRGLWDGRPSLGGVWVAHPDVSDPERVMIKNTANGQSIVGALFRRERENPGPPLQISSDAADALGILAGAPTEISVVVLRREEVEVAPAPEENPVVAALDTPVNVEETPLDPVDPVAGAAAAIAAAEAATPQVDITPAPATPVVAAAAATVAGSPEAAALEQMAPALSGLLVQIGVFSIEPNAQAAAEKLRTAGVPSTLLPEQAGGRTVWRVVAGPAADASAQTAMIAQIKELGFVDAFGFEG